jgi:hypothetical protein
MSEADDRPEQVTSEEWPAEAWAQLPALSQPRILAGQSVSGINEGGGDENRWELDDEFEAAQARLNMRELRELVILEKIRALDDWGPPDGPAPSERADEPE